MLLGYLRYFEIAEYRLFPRAEGGGKGEKDERITHLTFAERGISRNTAIDSFGEIIGQLARLEVEIVLPWRNLRRARVFSE